jgi:branched-chain amino acid transport system ATP-binding protein
MLAIGRADVNPDICCSTSPRRLACHGAGVVRHLARVREAGVGSCSSSSAGGLRIADRGYVLDNGVIVGHGTADHLKADPAVQRAYLGGPLPAAAPSS